jgi:hypothetical protein
MLVCVFVCCGGLTAYSNQVALMQLRYAAVLAELARHQCARSIKVVAVAIVSAGRFVVHQQGYLQASLLAHGNADCSLITLACAGVSVTTVKRTSALPAYFVTVLCADTTHPC